MLQGFLGRRGGLSSVSMGTIGTGRLLRAPKRETWRRFWHLAPGGFPERRENAQELVFYGTGRSLSGDAQDP